MNSSSRSGRGRRMLNEITINAGGKTRLRNRDKGNERDLSTGEIMAYPLERQATK